MSKYTSGESASGWSKLGKVRRSINKRKRTTNIAQGALGLIGTGVAFGLGQAKKAKTAWDEYEAGYKHLGGTESIDRSLFKSPEGEIRIDNRIYDMKNIRKLGEFTGSDMGAMLLAQDDTGEMMTRYQKAISPGRLETEKDIYKDIAERFNLDPSEVVAGGVSSKQPYASEINVPTGFQDRKKIQDYSTPIRINGALQTPAWEPPRDVEPGDVARMKGKEFYEKDYYTGLSEWDHLLKKRNLWDSKNENNKNKKKY